MIISLRSLQNALDARGIRTPPNDIQGWLKLLDNMDPETFVKNRASKLEEFCKRQKRNMPETVDEKLQMLWEMDNAAPATKQALRRGTPYNEVIDAAQVMKTKEYRELQRAVDDWFFKQIPDD